MPAPTRGFGIVTAILLAVFCVLAWYVGWFGGGTPAVHESSGNPAMGNTAPGLSSSQPDDPSEFEEADDDPPPRPAVKSAPAFKLSGTVLAGYKQAILKNLDTGVEGRYTEGDVLAEGVTLLEVRQRQVVLEVNGERVVLDIGVDKDASAGNVAGTWKLLFWSGEENDNPMGLDTRITQSGARLTLSVPNQETELGGSLTGSAAQFEGAFGTGYVKVDGAFNESWDVFEGTGTLDSRQEAGPTGGINPITVRMTRITDQTRQREQEARAFIEARQAEVRTLAEALKAYAAANGKLPATLDELVPHYVKDPDLIAMSDGRELSYRGGALIDNSKREALAAQYDFQHGNFDAARAADQLRAWEAGLREVWGSEIPVAAPVLRVRFSNPDMTMEIDATGHARTVKADRASTIVPPQNPAEYEAWARAMRASDQNNLKQLGLVMKMFQVEHNDYLPGGWLSVYPEYLTDPNVLRSPWAPEGTQSYDFLFPAMSQQELYAVAEQLSAGGEFTQFRPYPDEPESARQARLASVIPLIIGRDEAPLIPGEEPRRSALFLDGHVETMALDEWDLSVTPFLRYASR